MQKGFISPVVILLVILTVVAFFLGTKYPQAGNTPVSQTIQTISNSPKISNIKTPTENDWVAYKINKLNLEFKLPQNLAKKYGKLIETETKGQRGSQLKITFTNNPKSLTLITQSPEYEPLPSNTEGPSDTVFLGFKYDYSDGKYYGILPYEQVLSLPIQYLTHYHLNGRDILKATSLYENHQRVAPGYGLIDDTGYIWGIINNPGPRYYPGLTISGKMDSDLTEEVFEQILSTFK